jgi:hypothetical protein
LMLCTGFFMGVFIATYQVTADSLFLNRLGGQLDRAFLVAGLLGIVTHDSLFYCAKLYQVHDARIGECCSNSCVHIRCILAHQLR